MLYHDVNNHICLQTFCGKKIWELKQILVVREDIKQISFKIKQEFDYSTQQLAYEELGCCGGVELKAVAKEGAWLVAVVCHNNMFNI